MSLVRASGVQVGANVARTKMEFRRGDGARADSKDPWQILPNLYAASPVPDCAHETAFGVGITAPYGQSVEWDRHGALSYVSPYFVQMRLGNINPSISGKISDGLYLGLGADVFVSDMEFRSLLDNGPLPGDADVRLEADGVGFGAHAGLLWLLAANQRLALTYRSSVQVDYEGDARLRGLPVPPRSDFETEIRFPAIVGLGYEITLRETIRLEANAEWLDHSVNDKIPLEADAYQGLLPAELPQDWDDSWTFGVAGDWLFRPRWILRAGYAFLESPVPDATFSPSLPDADRHVMSIGLGYVTEVQRLDVAWVLSRYDERRIRGNPVPPLDGDYEICSDLLGLSYTRSF